MPTQKIDFINHEGHRLSARLDLPADQHPRAFALFAHCFTCHKNFPAATNIARELASSGIAVMRFDFTGLGQSEGEFKKTNFSTNITDILAAHQYLSESYEAPELLIGHSLGGAAMVFAASRLDSVRGVVTIAAPSEPKHVTHLFQDALEDIKSRGQAEVSIAGRKFIIEGHFIEALQGLDLGQTVHDWRKAFLIMHSPIDNVVGIENAANYYSSALHPKSFISLDGADHILSKKEDGLYVAQVIASWAMRYLSQNDQDTNLNTTHQVVVNLQKEDIFTTQIKAGHHYLTADEPKTVGGHDFGPSPYDLVTSGLGACTAMTLHMYARRKKWPLEEVKVHLSFKRMHAEDCLACVDVAPNSDGKIEHITRLLEIKGDLDQDQRKRLLEIADRCPVHRTLEAKVHIQTVMQE